MVSFYSRFPKSVDIAGRVGRRRFSFVAGTLLLHVLIFASAPASGQSTAPSAKASASRSATSSEQAVVDFKDGRLSVSVTNQPLAQVLSVISQKAMVAITGGGNLGREPSTPVTRALRGRPHSRAYGSIPKVGETALSRYQPKNGRARASIVVSSPPPIRR